MRADDGASSLAVVEDHNVPEGSARFQTVSDCLMLNVALFIGEFSLPDAEPDLAFAAVSDQVEHEDIVLVRLPDPVVKFFRNVLLGGSGDLDNGLPKC